VVLSFTGKDTQDVLDTKSVPKNYHNSGIYIDNSCDLLSKSKNPEARPQMPMPEHP
jgi:hypothetical protein